MITPSIQNTQPQVLQVFDLLSAEIELLEKSVFTLVERLRPVTVESQNKQPTSTQVAQTQTLCDIAISVVTRTERIKSIREVLDKIQSDLQI